MNEIFNMYLGIIDDESDQANIKHPLVNILKLAIIAVLCGMDELNKIVDYGKNKKEFLEKEFGIKAIPSKSTLTRIFIMISPKWLGLSISCILKTIIKEKEEQIMLDGKAIRATEAIKTIDTMMNIVTAYTDTGISLCQIPVDGKSNEIPAVRELIDMMDIEGIVITADAMHCQKETAEKIIDNKGDYVLQLKANQGRFYEEVYAMFDEKYMDENDKDCEYEIYSTLDVSYNEDMCRLYSKKAQENMNILRKIGIGIHKNYLKEKKQTVKSNMFNCLLNNGYLLEILQNYTIL